MVNSVSINATKDSIIIREIELSSKKDVKEFVDLPWSLYPRDSHWVPPLKMAVKEMLNPKHPFYKTAEVKAWIAYKNERPVGRIMAINNHNYNTHTQLKTGHFGFFETIDDLEVSRKLLSSAADYLKAKGLTSIQGPMNPGTNYECGLLVDSFDDYPQIMMTYSPSFYLDHLSALGFQKEMDLLAYNYRPSEPMPEVVSKIALKAQSRSNIGYRKVDIKNWARELEIIFDIYNSAWEVNWGFVPMTKEEFAHSAKDLKMIINPEYIHFVLVNGVEAGFILAIPDYNQVFKQIPNGSLNPFSLYKLITAKKRINRLRVIMMGLKKEHRKSGVETLLYMNLQESIQKNSKITDVELSWILETNTEMNKPLIKMTGEPYKRYRLVSKALL